MARLLGELLRTLGVRPEVAVGHSAGAAILARMCLDGAIAPRALVSLNGAMLPLRGVPGHVFSPIARLVVSLPLTRRMFAWQAADRRVVARMLRSTGSSIDPAGVEQYVRLARCPAHAGAALTMMANWDLRPLQRDLPRLRTASVADHRQQRPHHPAIGFSTGACAGARDRNWCRCPASAIWRTRNSRPASPP